MAHHGEEHHGKGHHGPHHETKHYSDRERNLYGFPKNTWNECTDAQLDYITCAKDYVKAGSPLSFIWTLHWSDRWHCKDQDHVYKDCQTTRMLRIFDENKDEIESRR